MFEYFKSSFNIELRYAGGKLSSKNSIDIGMNFFRNGFFYSTNSDSDTHILNNLKNMNLFMDTNYLVLLEKALNKLNKTAVNNNLYFSAFFTYGTEYISISNVDDYRNVFTGKIALSRNNDILYTEIDINDDIDAFISSLYKNFFELIKIFFDLGNTIKFPYKTCKDIIFSPEAASYFVHEVFGHMLEGDFVVNKSTLFSNILVGTELTCKDVNIIDDPNIISGIGLSKIDDEGEKLKRINLIVNGKLNGYLCDHTTAKLLGSMQYSGCARSQSYKFRPIPRMRNTYISNNKNGLSLNEIKANTYEAILVDKIYFGQVDNLTGNYKLKCGLCSLIKNGKAVSQYYSTLISGNILNTLKSIKLVGNDLKFIKSKCVKSGQIVNVGMGSPSLVVGNLLIE